jgi:predicted Zn-dependent peptidase
VLAVTLDDVQRVAGRYFDVADAHTAVLTSAMYAEELEENEGYELIDL